MDASPPLVFSEQNLERQVLQTQCRRLEAQNYSLSLTAEQLSHSMAVSQAWALYRHPQRGEVCSQEIKANAAHALIPGGRQICDCEASPGPHSEILF